MPERGRSRHTLPPPHDHRRDDRAARRDRRRFGALHAPAQRPRSVTYCPDRSASRSVDDYIEWAQRDHVKAIRGDLAPRDYELDVRVEESTKGLAKPAQAAFKNAVRLTKSDQTGACAAWTALTRDAEPTAALAFNLGLCAEMQGDFTAATRLVWRGAAARIAEQCDSGGRRADRTPSPRARRLGCAQALARPEVRKPAPNLCQKMTGAHRAW
jgi:hypothetical protein